MTTNTMGRLAQLSMLSLLLAPAAALAADPETAAAPGTPSGQIRNGIAVEADFALSLLDLGIGRNGDPTSQALPIISGGFFAGYKLDRFLFGVGFAMSRLSFSFDSNSAMMPDFTNTATTIAITPGIRIAALRSADQRAELFGQLDIGWLRQFRSTDPPPMMPTSDVTNSGFTYRVGPGIRYWIHPSVAFFVVPTLRGRFLNNTSVSPDGSSKIIQEFSVTTLDADIGFLGVF